jgi:hypothetical protein
MEAIETKIINKKTLRISIDQKWYLKDFMSFFESIEILNFLIQALDICESYTKEYDKKVEIFEGGLLLHKGEGFGYVQDLKYYATEFIEVENRLYKKTTNNDISKNIELLKSDKRFEDYLLFESKTHSGIEIKKIKFSSPGITDLTGVAKVIEVIFNFLTHYIPNKSKKIDNKLKELEYIEKQIYVLERLGYPKSTIKRFIDLKNNSLVNILELRKKAKIINYEILEGYDE